MIVATLKVLSSNINKGPLQDMIRRNKLSQRRRSARRNADVGLAIARSLRSADEDDELRRVLRASAAVSGLRSRDQEAQERGRDTHRRELEDSVALARSLRSAQEDDEYRRALQESAATAGRTHANQTQRRNRRVGGSQGGCMSFESSLGTIRIKRVENSGAGNCQFEAISQGLNMRGYKEMRRLIADAIEQDIEGTILNNETMRGYVAVGYEGYEGLTPSMSIRHIREVVARRVRGAMWGNDMTLVYASALFDACFIMLSNTNGRCTTVLVGCDEQRAHTIALFYELDVHYTLAEFQVPGEGPVRSLARFDNPNHWTLLEDLMETYSSF